MARGAPLWPLALLLGGFVYALVGPYAPPSLARAAGAGDGLPDAAGRRPAAAEREGWRRCTAPGGWARVTPSKDARFASCGDLGTVQDDTVTRWCANRSASAAAPRFRRGGVSIPTEVHTDIAKLFDVWLCAGEGELGLAGAVRVDKLGDCNASADFTSDPIARDLVTKVSGPDEFYLSLEGPEVHALTPRHLGGCSYEAEWAVTVPGRYRLGLVWSRVHWAGVDEVQRGWPSANHDLPIGTEVVAQIGSADAAVQRRAREAAFAGDGLPRCADNMTAATLGGRWVWDGTGPTPPSLPLRPLPNTSQQNVRGFAVRVAVDYTRFEWRPMHCRMHRFSSDEARTCLQGRRVMLQGDSHMRASFNALLEFACLGGQAATKEQHGGLARRGSRYVPPGGKFGECDKVDLVTYVWDTQLLIYPGMCRNPTRTGTCPKRKLRAKRGRGLDSVTKVMVHDKDARCSDLLMVNAGQHQADGRNRWSFKRYSRLLYVVAKWRMRWPQSVAWHQTNALPFRMDKYHREVQDQRTLSRLRVFNALAGGLFPAHRVLPSFDHTLPFAIHTEDNAHYPARILQQSVAQHILNMVCPAGNLSYVHPHTRDPSCKLAGLKMEEEQF
eukprot:TRINITY_DN19295_c0_g1_i2.p1 TRINITY_DN19295_c0_g1~~TRINITY_DN19295_c0_g1_i2.p1  ORF type:complete len:612 (+),score=174.39 TRINITY_DN19295_c0_g1_i2:52-1887(+)